MKTIINKFLLLLLMFIMFSFVSLKSQDTSIQLVENHIAKVRKEHDDSRLISALIDAAKAYQKAGKTELAKKHLYEALTISKKYDNPEKEAEVTFEIGVILCNNQNDEEALKTLLWVEFLLKNSKNYPLILKTNTWLSYLYNRFYDYSTAIKHNFNAFDLIDYAKDQNMKFYIISSIGHDYQNLNMRDSALKYFDKAQKMLQKNNNASNYADLLINKGKLFIDMNDDRGAIQLFKEALSIAQKINYYKAKSALYLYLSQAYCNIDEYDIAESYINEALDYTKNSSDSIEFVLIRVQQALVKLNQKKYKESISILLPLIETTKKLQIKKPESNIYYLLTTNYSFLGNSKEMEKYSNLNMKTQYEMDSKNNEMNIALLYSKNKVELALKDAINERIILEAKHKQFVTDIILISLLVLSLAVTIYIRRYYLSRYRQTKTQLNIENEKSSIIDSFILNDIKTALMPLSIFIADNTSDVENKEVRDSYNKITNRLNQLFNSFSKK